MIEKNEHPLTTQLLAWYKKNKRNFIWRNTKEPYKIWVSEIIMQQTRVAQGSPYYDRFLTKFPTLEKLAEAPLQEVLKIWEGLGYYSRARNMHFAAQQIVNEYDGQFPTTYNEIIKLKGIGEYTASAIASISFNEPTPVIDGNVFRVVSRLFELKHDILVNSSKKHFQKHLKTLISVQNPGDFNQAMMELGATICSVSQPKCLDCPFSTFCKANKNNSQSDFPVKIKNLKIRKRYFHYIVFNFSNYFAMKKRTEKDIWHGLYDFYLIETEKEMLENHTVEYFNFIKVNQIPMVHKLTHQIIYSYFYSLNIKNSLEFDDIVIKYNLEVIPKNEIGLLPKPKLINNFLDSWSHFKE